MRLLDPVAVIDVPCASPCCRHVLNADGTVSRPLSPLQFRLEIDIAFTQLTAGMGCVGSGIDRVEEERVRERQEDFVRWEKRYKGLCRNEYYVGTPATRTITEKYSETTYRLEPAKIKVSPCCIRSCQQTACAVPSLFQGGGLTCQSCPGIPPTLHLALPKPLGASASGDHVSRSTIQIHAAAAMGLF